jgi:hypothetical protein
MKQQLKSYIAPLGVAFVLAVVLGGGALAAIALPDHSVGWRKLSPGVQKRIAGKASTGPPAGPRGEQGEPGPPGLAGKDGQSSPSGFAYPAPNCAIVEGDCVIYSVDFWRLQAEFAEFEISTGEYPEPPLCTKAAQDSPEGGVCPQVVSYLYPNGDLGEDPWVLSPDAKGWQFAKP